jgi:uncharacterized protein (DUF1499 family)
MIMADMTMSGAASRLAYYVPRGGFWLAVLAALMLAAGPIGWRLGLWHFRFVFWNIMEPAAFIAAGALVISLIALFWWGGASTGGRVMTILGILAGAVLVYYPVQYYAKVFPLPIINNTPLPRIHDITTDMANPPQFQATLAAREAEKGNTTTFDPKVGQTQQAGYPDIAPLKTALPPAEAFKRAQAAAESMSGWTIVKADAQAGTIEGSQRTRFMGFTDDFVIRVSPDGAGSRIDMRSESRQGISDFGVNAARIRSYMAALKPTLG